MTPASWPLPENEENPSQQIDVLGKGKVETRRAGTKEPCLLHHSLLLPCLYTFEKCLGRCNWYIDYTDKKINLNFDKDVSIS